MRLLVLLAICLVVVGCTSASDPTTSTLLTVETTTTSTDATAVVPEIADYDFLSGAAMAQDPVTSDLILFGGVDRSGAVLGESWSLSSNDPDWKYLNTAVAPPARAFSTLTTIDSIGGVVLIGGSTTRQAEACTFGNCLASTFLSDMWSYEASSGWDQIFPSGGPGARSGHAAAYDSVNDTLVLFGGVRPPEGTERRGVLMDDTWLYGPGTNSWELVEADIRPIACGFHQMVYDPMTEQIILWGGYLGGSDTDPDVWTFDVPTRTWTQHQITGDTPPGRWSHAMAYDPSSNRVVVFGGAWYESGNQTYGSDVWSFDPQTMSWQRAADLEGGFSRASAAAQDNDVVLFVFGSTGRYDVTTDTWVWNPVE